MVCSDYCGCVGDCGRYGAFVCVGSALACEFFDCFLITLCLEAVLVICHLAHIIVHCLDNFWRPAVDSALFNMTVSTESFLTLGNFHTVIIVNFS